MRCSARMPPRSMQRRACSCSDIARRAIGSTCSRRFTDRCSRRSPRSMRAQAALSLDLLALADEFNRAGDGTMAVRSDIQNGHHQVLTGINNFGGTGIRPVPPLFHPSPVSLFGHAGLVQSLVEASRCCRYFGPVSTRGTGERVRNVDIRVPGCSPRRRRAPRAPRRSDRAARKPLRGKRAMRRSWDWRRAR